MKFDRTYPGPSFGMDETFLYDPEMVVEKTKESFVWFSNFETPFIDFIMGYSSTNFGHSNKKVLKAVKEAIQRYDNLPAFNSLERKSLDKKIINQIKIPNKNYHIYYTVGGAKAIDAAIKLVRAATRKNTIITFKGNFHGYSYGAMMVTDENFVNKTQYGTMPGNIVTFPFPNRLAEDGDFVSAETLLQVENYLLNNHSRVAGIIYEPIQGAAGFIIPPNGFLPSLQGLALKYNIPTICDEIQSGIGRAGNFISINGTELTPDIILLGKSLAGGYYPLSAVIASENFFKAISKDKSGFDSTFSNNNLGIAIADKVLDILTDDFYHLINQKGKALFKNINKLKKFSSIIKEIECVGLACSMQIECQKNPLLSSTIASEIKMEAFKQSLIIQTAGLHGDYLKISPSFFISRNTMKTAITILEKSIEVVLSKWEQEGLTR